MTIAITVSPDRYRSILRSLAVAFNASGSAPIDRALGCEGGAWAHKWHGSAHNAHATARAEIATIDPDRTLP